MIRSSSKSAVAVDTSALRPRDCRTAVPCAAIATPVPPVCAACAAPSRRSRQSWSRARSASRVTASPSGVAGDADASARSGGAPLPTALTCARAATGAQPESARSAGAPGPASAAAPARCSAIAASHGDGRSEEHTSELQSRENLVCRLLLEKKKTKIKQRIQCKKKTKKKKK